MLRKILSLFSLLFFPCTAFSQQLQFTTYTTAQGLSQNSVYSIAQTKEGFIWLGTQDGINRFDGRNIWHLDNVPIVSETGACESKSYSKMFTALHATAEDKLLCGTTNELLVYDRYRHCFLLPDSAYPGLQMPPEVWIKKIAEDDKQHIWILTTKKGLFVYDKIRKKMLKLNNQPPGIADFSIGKNGSLWVAAQHSVYAIKDTGYALVKSMATRSQINVLTCVNDNLWIADENAGICILSANQSVYTLSTFANSYPAIKLPKDPNLILQANDSTVWVGSRSSGIIKLNLAQKTYEGSTGNNITTGLSRQFVLSCFSDASKSIWVGLSGGGVAKHAASKGITFDIWRKNPDSQNSQPDNMCFSIYAHAPAEFYMGTLHSGLMYLNTASGKIQYYAPVVNDLLTAESKNIYSIIKGADNSLWMATWGGLYNFNINTKRFTQYVDKADKQTTQLCSVIKLKHMNKLLVGGYQGDMRMFDLTTKQFEKCKFQKPLPDNFIYRIRYMQEAGKGDIYMSTEGKSFMRYNYLTGVITTWKDVHALSRTSRFFLFHNNDLWIATDDGLIQADANSKVVRKLWSTEDGLPNNVIYGIVADGENKIWLSSNRGLSLLDFKNKTCSNYLEQDGLQNNEFNTACCLRDESGRIWFGGINGVNSIKRFNTEAVNYQPQTILIGFSVLNKPYTDDSTISYIHSDIHLTHKQNFLGFEFSTPGFVRGHNLRYQYKMQGIDTNWIDNGNRNYVNYAQLKPGKYSFTARAVNFDYEVAIASVPLTIIIKPAWYDTTLFYTLLIAAITIAVYALFRYRINQVKKVHALQQRISSDLHDDIGASLTSINILSRLSGQKNMDAATRSNYLARIEKQTAEVTDALRDIVWSINPRNETVSNIMVRMKRYAAEMLETNNIAYEFQAAIQDENINLELPVRQNLYYIFKEAINNLAKYSGAESALIKLDINKNGLYLEISDTGKGFNANVVKLGNGLENMRNRAKAIHATYELVTIENKGTVIKLNLPFKKNHGKM